MARQVKKVAKTIAERGLGKKGEGKNKGEVEEGGEVGEGGEDKEKKDVRGGEK